jgi:hypothetical protein
MGDFLSKISSYNLFNYLFPGVLFVHAGAYLGFLNLPDANLVANFFIYYFAGMIVSRVGSVIVEPLFQKFHIVEYAAYEDYLKACGSDAKLENLLEANNTYRTLVSLFLTVSACLLLDIVLDRLDLGQTTTGILLLIAGFILFVFSYRKQTSYIRRRVKVAKERT